MCGGAKTPKVEPTPPPPETVKEPDEEIKKAANAEKQKALAAKGVSQTIKTSGQGLTSEADVKKKQLLGQ